MASLFKLQNLLGNYKAIACFKPLLVSQQPQIAGLKRDAKDEGKPQRNAPAARINRKELKGTLAAAKIPEKPKKPPTPFFQFLMDQRSSILSASPQLKITEISKIASEKWKTVDEAKKRDYESVYKKKMTEYSIKMNEFEANLSAEQREALQLAKTAKKDDKERRKLQQVLRETNKPKRPMGAFMYFLTEQAKITNTSPLAISGTLKTKWHSLSPIQKEKYETQYQEAREKYEQELLKWEQKMLAEGRDELVRQKTLLQLPMAEQKVGAEEPKKRPRKQPKDLAE